MANSPQLKALPGWIHGSGRKLVQGHVVLDVLGDERAVGLGHGSEVMGAEVRDGGQVGELPAVDDAAHPVTGGVGLEEGLDGRDGPGRLGHTVGDELGELFFQ